MNNEPAPTQDSGEWVKKLRELYVSESPDEEGHWTKSICGNFGTVSFTPPKSGERVLFYCVNADCIEGFIQDLLADQQAKHKKKVYELITKLSSQDQKIDMLEAKHEAYRVTLERIRLRLDHEVYKDRVTIQQCIKLIDEAIKVKE